MVPAVFNLVSISTGRDLVAPLIREFRLVSLPTDFSKDHGAKPKTTSKWDKVPTIKTALCIFVGWVESKDAGGQ